MRALNGTDWKHHKSYDYWVFSCFDFEKNCRCQFFFLFLFFVFYLPYTYIWGEGEGFFRLGWVRSVQVGGEV